MRLRDRIRAFLHPEAVTNPEVVTKSAGEEQVSPAKLAAMQRAANAVVRASYDTVAKTHENWRHWQWVDYRSADASSNPYVREQLRAQSRYELDENNSYGYGMVETVTTDTIGTGPRLQVTEFSARDNREVEKAWHRWAAAVDIPSKLATLRRAKCVDGEDLYRFINNMTLDDPVMLDLQLIEVDQLRSPKFEMENSANYADGVHLDRFGNPYAYDVLRNHPGADFYHAVDAWKYDTYGYDQVVHTFRATRPGQHRGIPEFTPALPLFAYLRRFTLATVGAAETAASTTQVVETDTPFPDELEEEYTVSTFDRIMDSIPIDRNSATVLPNQWKLKQFAAEHPTTTYAMFKRELVSEIGRCCLVPVNVGTLDSGNSNFSSTKFDWLGYERKTKVDQAFIARKQVDRIFCEWLIEASLVGAIPPLVARKVQQLYDRWGRRGLSGRIEHEWYWDGLRDADQKDAADAQRVRLQNGSTHRAREYAVQGLDIETEDRKAAESFGVSVQEYRRWVMASIFTNGNLLSEDGNQSQETDSEEAPEAQLEPVAAD